MPNRQENQIAATYHVLTGAPGTGKTAILDELDGRTTTVAEPAREILAELRRAGEAASRDLVEEMEPARFVDLLLERSIEKHQAFTGRQGAVIFDRALPDCVGYANYLGVGAGRSMRAALRYRYSGTIFVLEPWAEIYTTDDERAMTFPLTVAFHEHLVAAYRAAGYDLERVPRVSIEERARFVENAVAGG